MQSSEKEFKFILNLSFDPHFCAFFNDEDQLVDHTHWAVPREDGRRVWEFLQAHLKPNDKLNFIGGITGPGSFSSLRTAGAILNTLSFKFGLPVYQARADTVIQDYLKTTGQADTPFLLNSFGQRVFQVQAGALVPDEATSVAQRLSDPVITTWLPTDKAAYFTSTIAIDPLGPLQTLLGTLKSTKPQPQFAPDYEYPPVQG